jgi:alpha-ribazole phosphatase
LSTTTLITTTLNTTTLNTTTLNTTTLNTTTLNTSSSTTRLWLIRHGEPAEEARGRCYGSLEVGLSERGRAQMARVAEYLKDEPIAAIYSSPRTRAVESAEILATRISTQRAAVALPDGRGSEGRDVSTRHSGEGLLKDRADASPVAGHGPAPRDVVVIPDLREIEFGDFEGLTYDEIAERYPDLYRQWMEMPTEIRFPNGECFSEMRSRVLEALDAIERERRGQTVAIVSHGGVNRILIAWALQISDKYLFRVAQDYAAVNLLAMEDGVPRVELMNHRVA